MLPLMRRALAGNRQASNFAPTNRLLATTRVPLIKFLGKRSLLPKTNSKEVLLANHVKSEPKAVKVVVGSGVEFFTLKDGAWYGRPKLTIEEIEAIATGGASALL